MPHTFRLGRAHLPRLVAVLLVTGAASAACGSSSDSPPPSLPSGAGDASTPTATEAGGSYAEDAATEASPSADVTADFGTAANPNGAWSYGYVRDVPTSPDAGALVLFGTVSDAPGVPGWYDATNAVLGAPAVWRNDKAVTENGVGPGELAVHPGNAGEHTVVRWTAPAAGTYAITLQFEEGDMGDTDGLLLHNGVVVVTEASTATGTLHELQRTLAAGDRLDVAVGPKGDFRYDSTPLRFLVRRVP